jgi:hypothetical protein
MDEEKLWIQETQLDIKIGTANLGYTIFELITVMNNRLRINLIKANI